MAKGFGNFGGGNMNNLMKQAQQMQKQMQKMQEEIETKEFIESVGGGAVTVTVNGKKNVKSVKIDKDVVDPDDVEELEELILTAVNAALSKAEEATSQQLGKITGGMNIPGMF